MASISAPTGLVMDSAQGRWVLAAVVLGSGLASIDATAVNVALPSIGRDLHAGFASLQWTVNAYALTLASFILLGGSLSDGYGRRRVFLAGVVGFGLGSALCSVAPTVGLLIAARALQGVAGALLTPGSLAIISASFSREDRGKAVGAWSGLGGIATAAGPFLGGYLVSGPGWRWVFLINVPLAVAVVIIARRHVPETVNPNVNPTLDLPGAALVIVGLGGVTFALIAGGAGWSAPVICIGAVGLVALVGFAAVERRSTHPMVPPSLFASRSFTSVTVVTFVVYAALGGVFLFLVVGLQVIAAFPPLLAGVSLLPVTVIMLALSAHTGALAARIGPRIPMAVGPLVASAGVLLMLRIDSRTSFLSDVLPAVTVFGIGLSLTVAPLTGTALAAAPTESAGIASGVNNAVARAGGLLAVAVLPLIAGITGADYQRPAAFAAGYRTVMVCASALLIIGGVIAAVTLRNPPREPHPQRRQRRRHCSIDGPPIEVGSTG